MAKFKVGDRVRILSSPSAEDVGKEAIVVGIRPAGHEAPLVRMPDGSEWSFHSSRLELITNGMDVVFDWLDRNT